MLERLDAFSDLVVAQDGIPHQNDGVEMKYEPKLSASFAALQCTYAPAYFWNPNFSTSIARAVIFLIFFIFQCSFFLGKDEYRSIDESLSITRLSFFNKYKSKEFVCLVFTKIGHFVFKPLCAPKSRTHPLPIVVIDRSP